MGAVEQTSETDDLLSEDVIDSQVSSRERDTVEGSERIIFLLRVVLLHTIVRN